MRVLEKALDYASGEGFVSTFLEEGPAMQGMLNEFLNAREGEAARKAATPNCSCRRIAQEHRSASDRAAAVEMQTSTVDALTSKEIQVLELLAQGYSNDAMAGKLFVSESTVRTHLRNINVKLRAGNRTQALVIARRLEADRLSRGGLRHIAGAGAAHDPRVHIVGADEAQRPWSR